MNIQNRYRWEAELPGGQIINIGDNLTDAVRFSLIPAPGTKLPRHDIVGVRMVRRFGRGYIEVFLGGLKEYVHCVVLENSRFYVRSTDGCALIAPVDYELYL
jgi:hypothetical protein